MQIDGTGLLVWLLILVAVPLLIYMFLRDMDAEDRERKDRDVAGSKGGQSGRRRERNGGGD
ncbi:MAG: hypothetical protein NUV69_00815 [Candidatus Curtissbacteria bacterium]|nr:hypothetical protein [Candidatus Curtissbacteria bacterium]